MKKAVGGSIQESLLNRGYTVRAGVAGKTHPNIGVTLNIENKVGHIIATGGIQNFKGQIVGTSRRRVDIPTRKPDFCAVFSGCQGGGESSFFSPIASAGSAKNFEITLAIRLAVGEL